MTSARLFLVTIAAVVLIAIAALVASDPSFLISGAIKGEPFYHSRPASYWIAETRRARSAGASRADVWNVLGQPEATPVLLTFLRQPDLSLRQDAATVLLRLPPTAASRAAFLGLLDDADQGLRDVAVLALAKSGDKARTAVPRLMALATGSDAADRKLAECALWKIDPSTAKELGGWRTFTSKDFGFSASMPGKVEQSKSHVDSPHGKLPVHTFEADIEACHFAVAVSQIAPDVIAEVKDWSEWLDNLAHARAEQTGAEVVSLEPIEHQGITAYESIDRKPETRDSIGIEIRVRHFIVGDKIYQALAVYPGNEDLRPAAADYFLNSFSVGDLSADTK
jgi:hypothetical protein